MYDRVFGKVEYDYGWSTPITLVLFNETYNTTCVASAYKNETINKLQRSQYTLFKESETELLYKAEQELVKYVEQTYPSYSQKLKESIHPRELIFQQDGNVGIYCDCDWDIETGIVIGIFPETKIINPDNFL